MLHRCWQGQGWGLGRFNIRSFGSWIASCTWRESVQRVNPCFNIRSFGSWIASHHRLHQLSTFSCFNIRSFGSWIASRPALRLCACPAPFQYPLFRIVDCFIQAHSTEGGVAKVSISALSDRGLLPSHSRWRGVLFLRFQYPLFRIVDCFSERLALAAPVAVFQYPLFRIVDCFCKDGPGGDLGCAVSISALSDRGLLHDQRRSLAAVLVEVSISALSDRGLLRLLR